MEPAPGALALERARLPSAAIEAVLAAPEARIVDLRSPSEFAADHLPGARNVPLFDDVERALIGTLYARCSPEAAFEEGRKRTRDKIHGLTRALAEVAGRDAGEAGLEARVDELTAGGIAGLEGALELEPRGRLPRRLLVLHCGRGGLRSRSVAAFLRGLGWDEVVLLEGGYRSYRRYVLAAIDNWRAPAAYVLRGGTGVGKTLVLSEIERLRPGSTLDLEQLAGHRSSILGMVGRTPCNQKTFESRLAARLARGFPAWCVVEGESRKVGDVILPGAVWRALDGGTNLELVAPVERRVSVLIEDYLARAENRAELARQLPFIEERLGRAEWAGRLVGMLDGRESELVRILLERYYDPLYAHSERGRRYRAAFPARDPARAAREIVAWIEEREGSPSAPRPDARDLVRPAPRPARGEDL
jgi:tRNA 2-selenouridine synthase